MNCFCMGKVIHFFFIILQEADAKLTQAVQYNPKVGQYYITRSRCRYMLEVYIHYHGTIKLSVDNLS